MLPVLRASNIPASVTAIVEFGTLAAKVAAYVIEAPVTVRAVS
jgi:hypothetical protein